MPGFGNFGWLWAAVCLASGREGEGRNTKEGSGMAQRRSRKERSLGRDGCWCWYCKGPPPAMGESQDAKQSQSAPPRLPKWDSEWEAKVAGLVPAHTAGYQRIGSLW